MEEQELNRKLAEWAGIRHEEYIFNRMPVVFGEDTPNFAQSLDACFKWLVPQLRYPHIELRPWVGLWEGRVSFAGKRGTEVRGKTPALALCKAIEQLIDEEAK